MLIDKEGMIVFKGHPASRDNLEDDINKLIAGEKITGEGTAAASQEKDEKDEDKLKEGDLATLEKIHKEVDEFSTVGPSMTKDDEFKKHAAKLPRGFCVMVVKEKYLPNEEKI